MTSLLTLVLSVELLTNSTPDFIPPTFWPPNSPDLNPMDYKIWSVMQEKVYQSRIEDVFCASASKQHGKNWTSALSILQSGSGAVAFMHVSRQKATTLSRSCRD